MHQLFTFCLQREIILNICSESAVYEQKIDQFVLVLQATPTQIKMMQVTLSLWCQLLMSFYF